MAWDDDEKVIDITDYRGKKSKDQVDHSDIQQAYINRSFAILRQKIATEKRNNYFYVMISILTVAQALTMICIIFILSKLN